MGQPRLVQPVEHVIPILRVIGKEDVTPQVSEANNAITEAERSTSEE